MKADNPGRASFTLSDLGVLIFGIALVLAFPWINDPRRPGTGFPFPPSRVDLWLQAVCEGIAKTCLAIVPVLVWRAARLGRALGSAELLMAACGASVLWVLLNRSGWLSYDIVPIPVTPGLTKVSMSRSHWLVLSAIWTLGGLAIAGRVLLRKRLRPWVASVLMVVVVLASFSWAIEPIETFLQDQLSIHGLEGTRWEDLAGMAEDLLADLIPALLGVSALFDLRRRADSRITQWLCLGLASSLFLVHEGWGFREWFGGYWPVLDSAFALFVANPLISGALGLLISWRIRPLWRRWMGIDYDHHGPTPLTSEA